LFREIAPGKTFAALIVRFTNTSAITYQVKAKTKTEKIKGTKEESETQKIGCLLPRLDHSGLGPG
jgi:hypothetical protein